MKRCALIWLAGSAATAPWSGPALAQQAPATPVPQAPLTLAEGFGDAKQQGSYALGVQMGDYISRSFDEGDLDLEQLWKGFLEKFSAQELGLSPEQTEASLQSLNRAMLDRRLAEGDAWLAGNAQREGVLKTESGLQYQILQEGNGPKPTAQDRVRVHYHGTLTDGTVFDSSVDRGQPSEFAPRGVIKGWQEALLLMAKGSKWKLFVPANLAYGERPRGDKIPPNAPLIFEVELLDILPGEPPRKVEAVTPPVRIPPLKKPGEEKPAEKPAAEPR